MSAEDVNLTKLKQSKIPIIWVIGGPGSGRRTLSDKLAKKYGFVHISSGDLLRAEVKAKTPKGKQVEELMKKGDLVPNDIIFDLLKQAISKQAATAKGYLINGFPTKVDQAKDFESKIKAAALILFLEAKDDTLTKRIVERGKTSGRPDDNAETMKKRLATFHKEVDPLVNQFKAKVVKLDANAAADAVCDKACPEINKILTAAGLAVPK